MLNSLAGQPEILDSEMMIPAGDFQLSGQFSENLPGSFVNNQDGFSPEALQGCRPFQTNGRIFRHFDAKGQFCQGNR